MAYSTTSDIANLIGAANRDCWADLDNDGNSTSIANAIAAAIERADAEIDDTLRNGSWAIPFGAAPTRIKWLSAKLAAAFLYQARGLEDEEDTIYGQMRDMEAAARQELAAIASGSVRLDSPRSTDGAISPVVVKTKR